MTDEIPLQDLFVVAAVILRGGLILAAKRKEGGPSGLKWEFAGGKVEQGESPRAALAREIMEELSLPITVGEQLGTFATPLGRYMIHLQCFWCECDGREPTMVDHVEFKWCDHEQLRALDWALPDIPAVKAILKLEPD